MVVGTVVPKNTNAGVKLITEVAKEGFPEGQFTLAMLYTGEYGLLFDRELERSRQPGLWVRASRRWLGATNGAGLLVKQEPTATPISMHINDARVPKVTYGLH